ncbi:MAG: hypothetical protein ACLTK8_03415 [Paeniclostridium sp.]
MKKIKFDNTYINLNKFKIYKFKTLYNEDTNELNVGFRCEKGKVKLNINHSKNILEKDTISKLDAKIQECIYDFEKSSTEFLDLDYFIHIFTLDLGIK